MLVDDEHSVGLPERLDDGFAVERQQGAQVNDLAGKAVLFLQLLSSFQAVVHHGGEADHGQVPALAPDGSLADGHGVVVQRHVLFDSPVEVLVLEEQHRVVVAHRRLDEALGVVGRAGADHLETRRVDEIHLRVLRVEGPAMDAAAHRAANHQRDRRAPAVVALGGEVGDLVEGAGDEVHELQLANRAQAEVAHADGRADDGALSNRCFDDALAAELCQKTFGDFERAAVNADVFADHQHGRVAFHLLAQALRDRLQIGHGRHGRRSS